MTMKTIFLLTALSFLSLACDDASSDDDSNEGGGGATATGAGGSGGEPVDIEALYACEEVAFGEARPLSGTNFDLSQGGFLTEPTQQTFVVHATQIYVPPDQSDRFFELTGPMFGTLPEFPGNVAWTVGGDDTCLVNRTMGIWESEEALYAFVGSPEHAAAMAETTTVSYTGRTTHWTVTKEEAEALSWDVARAKLAEVEPSALYD
jgi:heme-degrading monooxygenase HmoA